MVPAAHGGFFDAKGIFFADRLEARHSPESIHGIAGDAAREGRAMLLLNDERGHKMMQLAASLRALATACEGSHR